MPKVKGKGLMPLSLPVDLEDVNVPFLLSYGLVYILACWTFLGDGRYTLLVFHLT